MSAWSIKWCRMAELYGDGCTPSRLAKARLPWGDSGSRTTWHGDDLAEACSSRKICLESFAAPRTCGKDGSFPRQTTSAFHRGIAPWDTGAEGSDAVARTDRYDRHTRH